MDRYIGIDAHLQSCTLAVMGPSGRRLQERVVETNGQALRAFLLSIATPRHICLEEGELSEWLYELFLPLAKRVVVVQPEKRKGNKSDSRDAWHLADVLRTGREATVVYKAPGAFGELKEAVQAHLVITQDVVRSKNRLRALFRARGLRDVGQELCDPQTRQPWLDKHSPARRHRAELYAEQLDSELTALASAEEWLHERARACSAVKLLATAPGIGPIRASQTVATLQRSSCPSLAGPRRAAKRSTAALHSAAEAKAMR